MIKCTQWSRSRILCYTYQRDNMMGRPRKISLIDSIRMTVRLIVMPMTPPINNAASITGDVESTFIISREWPGYVASTPGPTQLFNVAR